MTIKTQAYLQGYVIRQKEGGWASNVLKGIKSWPTGTKGYQSAIGAQGEKFISAPFNRSARKATGGKVFATTAIPGVAMNKIPGSGPFGMAPSLAYVVAALLASGASAYGIHDYIKNHRGQ
jgi:hypothetical protein